MVDALADELFKGLHEERDTAVGEGRIHLVGAVAGDVDVGVTHDRHDRDVLTIARNVGDHDRVGATAARRKDGGALLARVAAEEEHIDRAVRDGFWPTVVVGEDLPLIYTLDVVEALIECEGVHADGDQPKNKDAQERLSPETRAPCARPPPGAVTLHAPRRIALDERIGVVFVTRGHLVFLRFSSACSSANGTII